MFMMNIKHLKKMQANQLEDLRELEIKNGSTVGKIPCSRPIKYSREQKGLQLLNRSHTLLKVRPLRSIHTIHIIHSGTKFKITFESSGPMICFFLFFYLAGGDQVRFSFNSPKGIMSNAILYISFVFQQEKKMIKCLLKNEK